METLSGQEVRRLVLSHQGLAGLPQKRIKTLDIIRQLGYVQIDTLYVVERAHHHTLWARNQAYRPSELDKLQRERKIFEYWSHAASYLPMEDYRYCLPRMGEYREGRSHWFQHNPKECQRVLERIRCGPLTSQDFVPPPGQRGGKWFDWKPSKMALEQLFMAGILMVTRREGMKKVYDLAERVLPAKLDTVRPTPEEFGRWRIQCFLNAQGIATLEEITYLRPREKKVIQAALKNMKEEGYLVEIQIEQNKKQTYYTLGKSLDQLSLPLSETIHLLSPFDNLVIQRKRIKNLFNFDYRIECYTPAAKRQYGHFTLPILWKDQFVGRLVPQAERLHKRLSLKKIYFEEHFKPTEQFQEALVQEFTCYAHFNNCTQVEAAITNEI